MAALDASAVAALLIELGRRTALAGDNYFRAKAYQRGADTLSAMVEPLDRVIAENRLRELPDCQRQRKTRPHGGGIVPPVSMCFPTKDWVSALACALTG